MWSAKSIRGGQFHRIGSRQTSLTHTSLCSESISGIGPCACTGCRSNACRRTSTSSKCEAFDQIIIRASIQKLDAIRHLGAGSTDSRLDGPKAGDWCAELTNLKRQNVLLVSLGRVRVDF